MTERGSKWDSNEGKYVPVVTPVNIIPDFAIYKNPASFHLDFATFVGIAKNELSIITSEPKLDFFKQPFVIGSLSNLLLTKASVRFVFANEGIATVQQASELISLEHNPLKNLAAKYRDNFHLLWTPRLRTSLVLRDIAVADRSRIMQTDPHSNFGETQSLTEITDAGLVRVNARRIEETIADPETRELFKMV